MKTTTLATLCALVFLAGRAGAADTTWGGGTGDWTVAGNWSAGVPKDGASGEIASGEAVMDGDLWDGGGGETAPSEVLLSGGKLVFKD